MVMLFHYIIMRNKDIYCIHETHTCKECNMSVCKAYAFYPLLQKFNKRDQNHDTRCKAHGKCHVFWSRLFIKNAYNTADGCSKACKCGKKKRCKECGGHLELNVAEVVKAVNP